MLQRRLGAPGVREAGERESGCVFDEIQNLVEPLRPGRLNDQLLKFRKTSDIGVSFRLVVTGICSFLARLLRLPRQGKTLLDRDVMIAVCLRDGHIICGLSAHIVEILGRAVSARGSTVDIFRRISPGFGHFGRGLLPRHSHIGGDCRRGLRTVATTR